MFRDTKLSKEKVLLTKSLSHNIFPEKGDKGGSPTIEISTRIRSNIKYHDNEKSRKIPP